MELSEVLEKRYMERQKARVKLDAANEQNVSLKDSQAPPEVTKSQTYFDMSPYPCTKPHRLELFWSILGDCIDERKQFIFQCENVDEAVELKKLTYTLMFQYSDRWRVNLDGLIIKANPPPPLNNPTNSLQSGTLQVTPT